MSQTTIGMMDSAYFVPRQEILSWINNLLKINIQHIEDLGCGSIYCQLLDVAFGQKIPMHRVNWKAKFEYEFINNLKIFQQYLGKICSLKKVDIEKLAKAKYQDNLQLIQWLKKYIELNADIHQQYDAVGRRNGAHLQSHTDTQKLMRVNSRTALQNNNIMRNNSSTKKIVSSQKNALGSSQKENKPYLNKAKSPKLNGDKKKIAVSEDFESNMVRQIRAIFELQTNDKIKLQRIKKIINGQAPSQLKTLKQKIIKEKSSQINVNLSDDEFYI